LRPNSSKPSFRFVGSDSMVVSIDTKVRNRPMGGIRHLPTVVVNVRN
jgi:hypothetical protein